MKEHFFMREGVGRGAGMVVHEFTKNFEHGRQHLRADPALPRAGGWGPAAFALDLAHPPVRYAADADEPPLDGLLDVLYRRRSVRGYAAAPLPLQRLGQLLEMAYPTESCDPDYTPAAAPHQSTTQWNGHVTACRLVLLARNVEGLAPGAYLVDEGERVLRRIGHHDLPDIDALLHDACFQREFHAAPALFLQFGSIHDAITRYGERGYRYMLFENGVMIQRLYLAASALSLSACVTGSLVQKQVETWIGADGYTAALLNGFAVGLRTPPRQEAR
ncbi:SagB/ThcOx family dehydrogenase [Stenotrophomonas sp.]|uniref:SagB/ThcOx family dehydrogenase n=1 Tax=Stenotrophomonas sp. TaxID=69392 RepID=UPI002FCB7A21